MFIYFGTHLSFESHRTWRKDNKALAGIAKSLKRKIFKFTILHRWYFCCNKQTSRANYSLGKWDRSKWQWVESRSEVTKVRVQKESAFLLDFNSLSVLTALLHCISGMKCFTQNPKKLLQECFFPQKILLSPDNSSLTAVFLSITHFYQYTSLNASFNSWNVLRSNEALICLWNSAV